jgi:hypothetical protein
MALDDMTTDSPQLAELISDQVTRHTAKLRGQVAQLQKQLLTPPKNRTRGANTSSAPRQNQNKKKDAPKTKKPPNKPRKPPNNPTADQPADGAANDSSNAKKRPGKNKRNKKKVSFARNGLRPTQR